MSGPKTSHYTLTSAQRRILEEQFRIQRERELEAWRVLQEQRRIQRERELEKRRILQEQRKISIERERFAACQSKARSVIAEVDRIIEQIEPLYAEMEADNSTLLQAKKLRKEAMDAVNQTASAGNQKGLTQLQSMTQNIHTAIQQLTSITQSIAMEYASADKAFRAEVAESIDIGFEVTFDVIGDTPDVSSSPLAKKIQAELESISEIFLTAELRKRESAIQAKLQEINDLDFLKNYYAMTIIPFVKECRAYHTAYLAYGEEYERKRYLYEANARTLGIVPEEIPFSADAVALLDAKIKETDEMIRHQDEQAYISQCVDEVMQEMGYTVVGNREVVRRNGKRFRNELYLFDEGTAVNVTYSSDGQITMELGGISTIDRFPTEAESTSLTSDMRAFCDDYCEMEQRLREKGILTKPISILPPEEQYAQIINVSDYSLSKEVSEYEARGTKRHTAKSKTQRIGD